ncbi:hypothetical protein TRV_03220 [Trichophyton verrucosum HKI 0517]|uniref:Uncharacterized protein n=1 Tax=Trichophyton verrucosum (strain HKI 0517) TaxID=663202 RepID=D4D7Y6_TRIVH|nr:uncharacterized protein TRV_03220 [Trichophyton verrucosum HKI 0517]EFE42042.1 hypothetical protein TRV_03220 [Trichophyton verrucosum HKI 0517]
MVSAMASGSDEKTRRCMEGQSRSAVSVDVDVDVADGGRKRERNSEEIKNLAGCSKGIFVCSSLSLAEEEQAWKRGNAPKVEGGGQKSGRRRLRYLWKEHGRCCCSFLTFGTFRKQNNPAQEHDDGYQETIDV